MLDPRDTDGNKKVSIFMKFTLQKMRTPTYDNEI